MKGSIESMKGLKGLDSAVSVEYQRDGGDLLLFSPKND